MGAVTYPDPLVIEFLNERFVPVRLHLVDEAATVKTLAVGWTPGLVVLDPDGRQHRRMFGFHPPADFVAELALGWLMEAIDRGHGPQARERAKVALEVHARRPRARGRGALLRGGRRGQGHARHVAAEGGLARAARRLPRHDLGAQGRVRPRVTINATPGRAARSSSRRPGGGAP